MINFRLPVSDMCSVRSIHCKESFAFHFSVHAAPRFFFFYIYVIYVCC